MSKLRRSAGARWDAKQQREHLAATRINDLLRDAEELRDEAIALLMLYVSHGKPPCLFPLDDGQRCCECAACAAGTCMSPRLERALGPALDRGAADA